MRITVASVGAMGLLLTACGSDANGRASTHKVRFDVGGFIAYEGDPTVGLPGVTITLGDSSGESFTAVTGSSGLWTITDIAPGVYTELYELTGYEPVAGSFAIDAFGENNVANTFISRPTVFLEETALSATAVPFGVEFQDGDRPRDGVAGETLVYSSSVDGAITITFSQRIFGGNVTLEDGVTSAFRLATQDTSTGTSFTFSEATIDGLNGGVGLSVETVPGLWHRIDAAVVAYTPIHGDPQVLQATLWFNAE